MKKLSDKQQKLLSLHRKPHKNKQGKTVPGHSEKHIKAMKVAMQEGVSFDKSHTIAMKIFGK
tara:strand:- start:1047 stop:1232 length:186 start_codon:yes stop_codon:yes gene_type:complete